MKNLFKLAWRNIWRNKRRTIITGASIIFAVFFAVCARSLHQGSWENMIDNIVRNYTGFIQIHEKGYWKDKSIEKTFVYDETIAKASTTNKNVIAVIPRFESFALANYGSKTKGIALIGILPEIENKMTKLNKKLIAGAFLKENDNGVMIARSLAKYLNINVNDTLVLIGQGLHGSSAAGIYPVRGILKFTLSELDNQLVYMHLNSAQDFYSAPDRVTSLALNITSRRYIDRIAFDIKDKLNTEKYEVMKWDEMLTELVQQYNMDSSSGWIVLGILYMVIGFGIFGTLLMMTTERYKEFGIMIAIGMKKFKLISVVIIEVFYLTLIGILTGLLLALPLLKYLNKYPMSLTGDAAKSFEQYGIDPIMPASLAPEIFAKQGIIILFLTICALIIPIYKLTSLQIPKTLKS